MTARLEVFEGAEAFRTHAESWDALLERTRCPSFFLRSDWLSAWADEYQDERRILLAVAVRDDEWIGGLPLAFGSGSLGTKFKAKKLECAGFPWFDRLELPAGSFADCKDTLRLILEWAGRELQGCDVYAFDEVPNGCDTLRALAELDGEMGFACYTKLASRAPIVDLANGSKTSKNYRWQMRRNLKRLEEKGTVEMDFRFVDPARADADLAECKAVEGKSWKGDQGVGVLRDGKPQRFFTSLWHSLTEKGDLALATMRLDGELVAYHWGFRHDERFLSYNLAQLPEVNDSKAGAILFKHMVENAEGLGFAIVDASRGSVTSPHIAHRYKGPVREHGNVVVYAKGLRPSTLRFLRHAVFPRIRKVLGRPEPPQLTPDAPVVG